MKRRGRVGPGPVWRPLPAHAASDGKISRRGRGQGYNRRCDRLGARRSRPCRGPGPAARHRRRRRLQQRARRRPGRRRWGRTDLARNQATARFPPSFENQRALYTDLGALAPAVSAVEHRPLLQAGRLRRGPGTGEPQTLNPRPGVTDPDRQPRRCRTCTATRARTCSSARATPARARLFQMEVLRHTARGTLTELVGPGEDNANVKMDVDQLKAADYTEAELQRMIDTAAASAGAEGQQVKQDLLAYVAGINKFIAEARTDPTKLPAEYTATGATLQDWKPTDTAAVASLIGGIFGSGGGAETRGGGGAARRTEALRRARRHEGAGRLPRVRRPRGAGHHAAALQVPRRQRGGQAQAPRAAAGEGAHAAGRGDAGPRLAARAATRSWRAAARRPRRAAHAALAARAAQGGLRLDGPASNATLVRAADSTSGRPLAVTGPQVAYYSPEILLELDLHGGGVDTRGAAFPGISLYVLIGRGKDYSWSATTATTDNVDEFVEELCEPRARAHARLHALPLQGPLRPDDRAGPRAAHARARRWPTPGRGPRHQAQAAAHRARARHQDGHGEGKPVAIASRPLDLHARAGLGARVQAAEPQRGHRRALVPAHDVHDQLPLQLVLLRRARHRLPPVGLVPTPRARHRPVVADPRHGQVRLAPLQRGPVHLRARVVRQLPKDINPRAATS